MKKVCIEAMVFMALVLLFAGPTEASIMVPPVLGDELIVNGGAETGDTTGWTSTGIEAVVADGGASGFGNFVFSGGLGPAASQTLEQDVDVSVFTNQIDNGEIMSLFNIYLQARTAGGLFDSAEATLSFRDNLGIDIESMFFQDDFDNQWDLFTDDRLVPIGTRTIRVLLDTSRTGGLSSDGFFDEVSLILVPEPSSSTLVIASVLCALSVYRRRYSQL